MFIRAILSASIRLPHRTHQSDALIDAVRLSKFCMLFTIFVSFFLFENHALDWCVSTLIRLDYTLSLASYYAFSSSSARRILVESAWLAAIVTFHFFFD